MPNIDKIQVDSGAYITGHSNPFAHDIDLNGGDLAVNKGSWSGDIYVAEDSGIQVYDNSTISGNLTAAEGKTLTVKSATFATGGKANPTLTLNGTVGKLDGATLDIQHGTVKIANQSGGNAIIAGAIKVGAGATLLVEGADSLGYSNAAGDSNYTDSITAEGTEGKLAKVQFNSTQTMSADLVLKGYTEMSGSTFNSFDGDVTVSGTNNTIKNNFSLRREVTFTIGDEASLTAEGEWSDFAGFSGKFIKDGAGEMTISGLITSSRTYQVLAGTLNISGKGDEGTANTMGMLDMSAGNVSTGRANIKEGTALTLTTLWGGSNSTVALEKDACLSVQGVVIKGLSTETPATITSAGDYEYRTESAHYTISNAQIEINQVEGSKTLSNKLIGTSKLVKSGAGDLTLNGTNNTYSGGTEVTGGKLIVSSGSSLGSGDVSITNATVEANHTSNNGTSIIGGGAEVSINTGGTLKLSGHDMLGWGNNSPAKIILGSDDATKVAKLDIADSSSLTMKPAIEMNGNAEITGNTLNTYGTSLTVKKGTNKIKVATLHMRSNFEIAIAKEAVLTIESLIAPNIANEEPGDITKSGVGTLELTNTGNTWDKNMHVTGGTLRLVGAANLPGSVTMDSGTRLETGTGTIGNLTMAGNSTLDADTAVTLNNGTLTFNGVVNLDGAIKNALYAGEQTVKLFTGITSLVMNGTTYDSTARVAYNPVDLEEVFAFDDLQEDKYQLHYSGGELFATLSVPEPATATLSLLALAGLCARRRRKS